MLVSKLSPEPLKIRIPPGTREFCCPTAPYLKLQEGKWKRKNGGNEKKRKGLKGQLVHPLLIQACCWQYFHIHECFVQATLPPSLGLPSALRRDHSIYLLRVDCMDFFFLSFIFIFTDKPSSKDWVARPKLLHSTGWIFFFSFLRMGKSFQSRITSPLLLTIMKPWLQKHLIHPLKCNLLRTQKYSITWKHSLFWRIRNNGLLPQ